MRVYVGTSGWAYKAWNPDGLAWYVAESGLNAIELNMSFYRFPKASHIDKWKTMAGHFIWIIKVNQLFTHRFRFSEACYPYWKNFKDIFKALDKQIAFYLFQLPPSMTPSSVSRIEAFFKRSRLKKRFALEWRHRDWFQKTYIEWASSLGLTLVSVDAPDLPRDIFNTNGSVYLRTHGRRSWYRHDYSLGEIRSMAQRIKAAKPKEAFVLFNNNEFMLINGRMMLRLF